MDCGMQKLTERLFDLVTGGEQPKVEERCYRDPGNGIPIKLVNELEGQEEQVKPHGTAKGFVNGYRRERVQELRTAWKSRKKDEQNFVSNHRGEAYLICAEKTLSRTVSIVDHHSIC